MSEITFLAKFIAQNIVRLFSLISANELLAAFLSLWFVRRLLKLMQLI